jgi:hypothetical protein
MQYKIFKLGKTFKVVFYKCSRHKRDIDEFNYDSFGTNDEKLENNLCRAKTRIKELALCNDWSHFVTLTLDGQKIDRYDLDGYVKKLGQWKSDYNKKYSTKLDYLLIPEQHKDGAWHMHGLMNGIAPTSLVTNDKGYLDMPYYQSRFGYISLGVVKNDLKIANYITKYVTKALQATEIKLCKHSFYHSRGLQGKELVHECVTGKIPNDVWTNDFVGVKDFDTQEGLTAFISKMQKEDEKYDVHNT